MNYNEFVGEMIWEEKRIQIKYPIKDTRILREKFKPKKITEPHANPLYYQKDYRKKREPHSHSVFTMAYTHTHICYLNSNDNTTLFIQKIRVTSYEITKLPLTHVLKFYELRSFQTGPLRNYASPRHYFVLSLLSALPGRCCRVLFWSDTKLLLWSKPPILSSTWNFKLVQPLYQSASHTLRDLQRGLFKIIWLEGFA